MKLIDLSQEIFSGMPAFGDHPRVEITTAVTHEERQKIENPTTISPVVHKIVITEHSGTHVDAFNHMGIPFVEKSIDTMPLETFFTEAICLDVSHREPLEFITIDDLKGALEKQGLEIKSKDTVLLYTDHYRKHFNTPKWPEGPGLSLESAAWLGEQGITAFGVEPMSPGILGSGNKEIHTLCGERGFTHYECLTNLQLLLEYKRFTFIALPLKIRGGTGSPVRAVALIND